MAILRFIAMVVVTGMFLAAAPQVTDGQLLRTHSMPPDKLVHKVQPEYPPAARKYRIQGTVRFEAIVGKSGNIERLRLISGHPLLVPASTKAVRQWTYLPTLMGDKPVRVITLIEIQFELDPYGNPVKNEHPEPESVVVL